MSLLGDIHDIATALTAEEAPLSQLAHTAQSIDKSLQALQATAESIEKSLNKLIDGLGIGKAVGIVIEPDRPRPHPEPVIPPDPIRQ